MCRYIIPQMEVVVTDHDKDHIPTSGFEDAHIQDESSGVTDESCLAHGDDGVDDDDDDDDDDHHHHQDHDDDDDDDDHDHDDVEGMYQSYLHNYVYSWSMYTCIKMNLMLGFIQQLSALPEHQNTTPFPSERFALLYTLLHSTHPLVIYLPLTK